MIEKFSNFLLSQLLHITPRLIAMEKKPYHHLPDGTFRNPEGSPVRTSRGQVFIHTVH